MESNNNNKAMSREKEILNASADTFISYGDEFTRAIKMLWVTAFIAGAGWADKHPVDVWHDASEMPKEGEWILIQFDEDSYDALVFCDMNAVAFCTCCKKCGSIRWAYISDLLPKQFGNSKQVKGGEQ